MASRKAKLLVGPQKQTTLTLLPLPRERVGVRDMVKRWCKRPPALAAMQAARQPPSGARSSRDKRLPASFESRVDCMSDAVMYRLERCSSMEAWSLRGYLLFGQNAAYRPAWFYKNHTWTEPPEGDDARLTDRPGFTNLILGQNPQKGTMRGLQTGLVIKIVTAR